MRPKLINDNDVLRICVSRPTRLRSGSERRAVLNAIIDRGGESTIEDLNKHFQFDTRKYIFSLIRAGWLKPKHGE